MSPELKTPQAAFQKLLIIGSDEIREPKFSSPSLSGAVLTSTPWTTRQPGFLFGYYYFFLWCFHMHFLAVRFGWTVTWNKTLKQMEVLREVLACPRSYKALNTLQTKPILAPKPTPFLDDQIEWCRFSWSAKCTVRTALGSETVFLELNGRITPLGESCMNTSYSLIESRPCKCVSKIDHS